MPRVGFKGIGKYGELAKAKLDVEADKLADRYDAVTELGVKTMAKKHGELDGYERDINDLEATALALSNGGPPLDDVATHLNGSGPPVGPEALNGAEKKTQDQDRPLQ